MTCNSTSIIRLLYPEVILKLDQILKDKYDSSFNELRLFTFNNEVHEHFFISESEDSKVNRHRVSTSYIVINVINELLDISFLYALGKCSECNEVYGSFVEVIDNMVQTYDVLRDITYERYVVNV